MVGKVSIIVPIYNVEDFLDKCMESILGQTYKNIEIILVDDGSTDSSGKIADKYAEKDSRIKVYHKKNGGLPAARNFGLRKISGKFVSFIDSDDWVDIDYISTLFNAMSYDDSDISVCGLYKAYDDENIKCSNRYEIDHEVFSNIDAVKDIMLAQPILKVMAWGKLYKKSLFFKNNIQYPKGRSLGEDAFTTYKLMYFSKKISYINKPLYYYRQRPGSIMSQSKIDSSRYFLDTTNEMKEFADKYYLDIDYEISNYKALNYNSFINLAIRQSVLTKKLWKELLVCTRIDRIRFITNPKNATKQRMGIFIMYFGKTVYEYFYKWSKSKERY